MFLDNSSCNLASFNLVKFLREDGTFDVVRFQAAVRLAIIAQDILVDHSGYPTEKIAQNSHDYRPLGLGYANLGALLLQMGLPYDSDEGRCVAASITAILGGKAYLTSVEIAKSMPVLQPANPNLQQEAACTTGAFPGFGLNREAFLDVMQMHLEAAHQLRPRYSELSGTAIDVWTKVCEDGREYGFRNAQTTVLAPTGTIAFMMDAGTTGIEPMMALVSYKKLVGGGSVILTTDGVLPALELLGYSAEEVETISQWISTHGTIEGAPSIKEQHLSIFDCAMKPTSGKRSISWQGHLKMMAATQPFLSGAISKTVNLPEESSVQDIMQAYIESWKLGVKAVAIYRDNSKGTQPVTLNKDAGNSDLSKPAAITAPEPEPAVIDGPPRANRNRLPVERASVTHKFSIANHEGYLTVGLYPNGQPGEIFLKMAKEGSTISGLMDAFATAVSLALQHGVPLKVLCDKFAHMRFEPSGWTGNQEIGYAKSLMDYIFRWITLRFVEGEQLSMFAGLQTPLAGLPKTTARITQEPPTITDQLDFGDAETCSICGGITYVSGTCRRCGTCGVSGGCS